MSDDAPQDSARLLINGLARQRTHMVLTLPGLERQPAVIPVALIADDGYAFVTLLPPQNPPLWLPPDTDVHAEGRLHGARVTLTSRLRQQIRGSDEWRLDMRWPTEVQHVQRRQAFRAEVPADDGMARVHLQQDNTDAVPATVRDISLTGVGLQPPRNWVPDEIRSLRCEWRMAQHAISLPLEVRHLSRTAQGTHLGARFLQSAALLQPLRQWVIELERHWLRRRQAA